MDEERAHPAFQLSKSTWTEADFEQMGWHDVPIHAIGFVTGPDELAFDIDYAFEWVDPTPGQYYFQFWNAPCTWIFNNVYELELDLGDCDGLPTILSVARLDPRRPKNADFIGRDVEWSWELELVEGKITFRSVGFTQVVHQAPRLRQELQLTSEERGGVSFSMVPFTG